jgi:hypothetical protein
MKQETATQAVLQKARPAAAVFHSSCNSFFALSFQLPPHLLEAVFLCPAGTRANVSSTSACEDADRLKYENII